MHTRNCHSATTSCWPQKSATLYSAHRLPEETEVSRAQTIVDAAQSEEMKTLEEIYARETLLLQDYPQEVSVPLQVLRIGDIAITAIPCEAFVEIGLHLKKTSPFPHTFPIELANGYYGYLPTAEQHAWAVMKHGARDPVISKSMPLTKSKPH